MSLLKWASWGENLSSGVPDQVRLKLAYSATEASTRLEILVTKTRDITLSSQQKQKRWSDCADAQIQSALWWSTVRLLGDATTLVFNYSEDIQAWQSVCDNYQILQKDAR